MSDTRCRQISRSASDGVVVVAGAQSRWVDRRKIKLEELVEESWTLPPRDSALGSFVLQAFRARGLPPPATTVVTESNYVRSRLAATGRFLTVTPEYAFKFPGGDRALLSADGVVALWDGRDGSVSRLPVDARASPIGGCFMGADRVRLLWRTSYTQGIDSGVRIVEWSLADGRYHAGPIARTSSSVCAVEM